MSDNSELIQEIARVVEQSNSGETQFLREELAQVQQQLQHLRLEDKGWSALFGDSGKASQGMSLEQLKQWSEILREMVAGSPLPKQANALRYSYTFSAPFIIPGLEGSVESKARRGPKPKNPGLKDFYNNPVNQRYVFGKEAQELISTACSTDSMYLALGDNNTKEIRPVPIHEIEGILVDPDFPGEVWAYLREWNPDPGTPENQPKRRWYYTDRYTGTKAETIDASATSSSVVGATDAVDVDRDKTMIDFVVNQQVGWPFGVADLSPGHTWNKMYVTMMNHGQEVSSALAHFALVVKSQSKTGAERMGVTVRNSGGGPAGNTALIGQGNEMSMLTGSKSAYDFSSLNPVAGMYALSVGVSLVDLLSNPSASGSSYGAAKALDPATRRGIEARRSQVAAFLERIVKWGTGEYVQITPASIEEVEPYRRAQILTLAWNSGLVHAEEVRPEFLYLANITPKKDTAPDGVLIPNHEDSLARSDIDTDGTGVPPTAASPGQGQGTGDGGAGSTAANDQRSDTQT